MSSVYLMLVYDHDVCQLAYRSNLIPTELGLLNQS